MSKIYIMRHAESTYNKFHTQNPDCDITENGRLQASRIYGHFDLVICSSLKRARQTLHYTNITYDDIIISDLCREQKIAICDFLDQEAVVFESKKDVYERVDKFRELLKEKSTQYKTILVVSHAIFITRLTKIKKISHCEIYEYFI